MKIGIFTFHRAINYGAFLQAFALKTYLTSLGNQVEIIDYWPEGHAEVYRLLPTSWKNRNILGKIKILFSFLIRYTRAKKRKDKMQNLVEKYFGLKTIPVYSTSDSLSNLSFDCFFYGSDQVWWKSTIPTYKGFDSVYWGENVSDSINKVAYAPSMGVLNLTEQDKNKIKKWLGNFSAISVREVELYNILHTLTEKNISVVLDPVFLLSREEWNRYCLPIRHQKYILYYNLIPTKESESLVNKLSKKFNCKVIEVTGVVYPFKMGKHYWQTVDAIEFISLIRDAYFVVTSSFHGTAFSILFRKQFYAIGIGKKAGRVSSLLSMLGISERLLDVCPVMDSIDLINYELVSKTLDQLILESKKFISNSLNFSRNE